MDYSGRLAEIPQICQMDSIYTYPPFLRKGDTIAITATARKVSPQEMQPCIDFFQQKGFKVLEAQYLYAEENQFAGTDEQRAISLQTVLDSREVKAIICARGGYGTQRILPLLDFSEYLRNPKWLIGFSDITCLHAELLQKGVASIHGPMAFSFAPNRKDAESLKRLQQLLIGKIQPVEYRHTLKPPLQRQGHAEGGLIGGNLSLLNQISGTSAQPDSSGKILFIEDLDEYLYHIDRMLQHLKASGWFHGLKGLIVGSMSDMKDNPIPFGKNALEIIADAVKTYDFPIAWYFPAGHEKKNFPLIIGANYSLSVFGHNVKLEMRSIPDCIG
jgi:muramoyltetrapeptide carboxypeptidase